MSEPKIYFFENTEQEAHLMGDYVAVCWNIYQVEENSVDKYGRPCKVVSWERVHGPYIGFVRPWDEDREPSVASEVSTIEGGLSIEVAKRVRDELNLAIDYILSLRSHE